MRLGIDGLGEQNQLVVSDPGDVAAVSSGRHRPLPEDHRNNQQATIPMKLDGLTQKLSFQVPPGGMDCSSL